MKRLIYAGLVAAMLFVCLPLNAGEKTSEEIEQRGTSDEESEKIPARRNGFFVPRSETTNLLYQDAIAYYYTFHEQHAFLYNGTIFAEKSRSAQALSTLLLQGIDVTKLLIAQDVLLNPTINAVWLDLAAANPPGFTSYFSLHPERSLKGLYNQFFFNFASWGLNMWADVCFAYVQAQHTLSFSEDVAVSGTGAFKNVREALNNPAWQFGKFCTQPLHKNGIDDVQLRLGYYGPCDVGSQWGFYAITTIPTGTAQAVSECIFEPLIGSTYYSAGVGINGDSVMWENRASGARVVWMVDCHYRYVFSREALRSFDTNPNGALSRYMLVARQLAPTQSLPAINFLTQEVTVQPRSTVQFWTGIRYGLATIGIEGGYNMWWRQQEKITNALLQGPSIGIFDINGTGTSASTATIAQGVGQAVSDASFVPLVTDDLDLESGAAPGALTHQLYAALLWQSPTAMPIVVSFGGSAEVGGKNAHAATENWYLFGKIILGF